MATDVFDPTADDALQAAEHDAALAFARRVREALGDDGKNMDVSRYAARLAAAERKLDLAHFLDGDAAGAAAQIAFVAAVEAFRAGRAAAISKGKAKDARLARIAAAVPIAKAALRSRFPNRRHTKESLYLEIQDITGENVGTIKRLLLQRMKV